MKNQTDLLDYGYLRFVDSMGDDSSIVRSARTSYDGANRAGDDPKADEKLTRYLLKNGHTTPFESCSVTFEVKAPIFVYRQWHRHRTQSYNEQSARYTELPEEFYVPKPEHIGKQSESSKQARELGDFAGLDEVLSQGIVNAMRRQNESAYSMYKYLIGKGVPKELARSILPVSMYSKMFATANLLNWYKFLKLRLHPHAQYEIRVYAEAMLEFLRELYPIATQAFEDYWLNPPSTDAAYTTGVMAALAWGDGREQRTHDFVDDPRTPEYDEAFLREGLEHFNLELEKV